jgi:hypothetical protein
MSLIQYFTNNRISKHELELESQGFEEYVQGLEAKVKFLDDSSCNLLKENKELKNENEMLKDANLNISLANTVLEEKVDILTEQLEINEILDLDKNLDNDYYNTKSLESNLLINTIDKITEERNTYKELINKLSDKFEIPQDAILDILDNIQISKSQQLEKTL